MNGKKETPAEADQAVEGNVTGLDHVGSDDASQLPDEERAITLPVEEGDFNAQSQ